MQKLGDVAAAGTPTDMVKWLNFTIIDMIDDLAVGKSFGCLHDSRYHSWVRGPQEGTKIGPYIRTMATYTDVRRLWRLLAPARINQARLRYENYVRTSAQERLDKGVMEERKDFLSYMLGNRDGKDGLTDKEVAANYGFLIIAGSEAAGTAMTGILFPLPRNPSALQTMTNEVRYAFLGEAEINFVNTLTCLPYRMACINECMRIYPPGPAIPPRRNLKGGMTDVAGYQVPGWVSFKFLRQVSNKEEMM